MKGMLSMLAVALFAVANPAVAGDVTEARTKADCDKVGGAWNIQSSECAEEFSQDGQGGRHA